MKNKISTYFNVRAEKMDKKGEVPICLRITINGQRASIWIQVWVDGFIKFWANLHNQ